MEGRQPMLKKPLSFFLRYDLNYPGHIDMIVQYENAILPPCPFCGAWHTAQVSAGIVSRSIHLAAATTKFTIRPNPKGKFICNECGEFFTPEDWTKPIWWEDLIDVDDLDQFSEGESTSY
jgi:hypothetical protein